MDLPGINFERADLNHSWLRGVRLPGTNLAAANLVGADFVGTDLGGANLSGADLSNGEIAGSYLFMANLSTAILRGTNISSANFNQANLLGLDLTRAIAGFTVFADVDLSAVQGLATIEHRGPSTVGIDTVYKSRGNIPEIFLRGAGVPEPFIANMRALVAAMEPIQFYSCFISYSTQDTPFAERLYADLRAKNLRCWFAPEDLKTGDRFQERIEDAIRVYDKVMIILSEESVKSRWVEREVNAAREREDHEDRTVLFPVRIDDTVMKAPQSWAAEIRRTRHIGDFRMWQDHDSYQKAFERLLRDLEADANT